MKVIAEFSDYSVQSIEYFITAIDDGIKARDIKGIFKTNDGRSIVEKINIAKEQPLVLLFESTLNGRNNEPLRTGILPAIGVTPGNMDEEAASMAESVINYDATDEWISSLKQYLSMKTEDIHKDLLISKEQIESIIGAYKRTKGKIRCQETMWSWNEEINISLWSETNDKTNTLTILVDSILAKIRVGMMGDESVMKSMKYKPVRGLTNLNFGQVLRGTEFTVTFLNTYKNFLVFEDEYLSGHTLGGTFKAPGEE